MSGRDKPDGAEKVTSRRSAVYADEKSDSFVVQTAVVQVLNAIHEQNFLGLSYGFRPGRGQHDALDALSVGIQNSRVRWILDVDIRAFFDTIDHEWMMCFLQHQIADGRVLGLIARWLRT